MEKSGWKTIKIEIESDANGKLITKKKIREFDKNPTNILGFERKDFIDYIIKLFGLLTILFTGLSYFQTVKQEKVQQVQFEKNLTKAIDAIYIQQRADLDKFNQEKRFESVIALKKDFSELQSVVYNMLYKKGTFASSEILKKVEKVRTSIRDKSLLLEDQEGENFTFCLWCYQGISGKQQNEVLKYAPFIAEINKKVQLTCKSALGLNKNASKGYEFVAIPKEGEGVNTAAFLDENFKRWQQERLSLN